MLLTFSKDKFVDLIKNGVKIHTIRRDEKRRWKPGMKIHFWRGNPRNVKANPYPFGEVECTDCQYIGIRKYEDGTIGVFVDYVWLTETEILQLAKNDGLTLDEFRDWFVPDGVTEFSGRIIHWTDKRY